MDIQMILTIGVPIALLVVEFYLGQTKSVEANSLLALAANILKVISGKK